MMFAVLLFFGRRVSATRYILPSVWFSVNDLIDKYVGVLHHQRKSSAKALHINVLSLFISSSFCHFPPCGSHFCISCFFFSLSVTLLFSSGPLPAVLIQ